MQNFRRRLDVCIQVNGSLFETSTIIVHMLRFCLDRLDRVFILTLPAGSCFYLVRQDRIMSILPYT